MPEGRSGKFVLTRACLRFGIVPPDTIPTRFDDRPHWHDLGLRAKMNVINYDRIATHDEDDLRFKLATLGLGIQAE